MDTGSYCYQVFARLTFTATLRSGHHAHFTDRETEATKLISNLFRARAQAFVFFLWFLSFFPPQTKRLMGGVDGGLQQVSTNLFCKRPDDKYLRLCRPEVLVTITHYCH